MAENVLVKYQHYTALNKQHFLKLQWQDYLVLASMLLVSAWIGIFFMYKARRSDRDEEPLEEVDYYLLAGKSITNPIAPALSLTASFMSAITVLGTPVEFYINGAMFGYSAVTYLIVAMMVAHIFIPMLHNMGISTSYEYLKIRFNSRGLEIAASIIYIVTNVIYCGIVVYAPSLALEQVTGVNVWIAAVITATVCVFYTTLGGLRAVLWTDVFQCITIAAGFVAIVAAGNKEFGSFSNMWSMYADGGRVVLDDFRLDPRVRHSFWSVVLGGSLGMWGGVYCVNQSEVQRYLSCKTARIAQFAVYINVVMLWVIMILAWFAGVTAYAYLRECDPHKEGWITSTDQTIPYLATKILWKWPGLAGLYVAGTYAGSLSTVSSGINSTATVIMTSLAKTPCFKKLSKCAGISISDTIMSKLLVIATGAVILAFAALASVMGPVLSAAVGILGVLSGPLLGLFLVGMTIPFADNFSAWTALILGNALAITIWVGGHVETDRAAWQTNKLPLETCGCVGFNGTSAGTKCYSGVNAYTVVNATSVVYKDHDKDRGSKEIFHISYFYYGLVGSVGTYIIGAVTALTRKLSGADIARPDECTLLPFLRNENYGQLK